MLANVISDDYMYVLLGDPGYLGPPGLSGESGQNNTRVISLSYY